jgi:hypothetical protein
MNASQFGKEIRAFGNEDVPDLVRSLHQKVMMEGLIRLVSKTPVRTGRARSNWQVGIGGRAAGTVESERELPRLNHPRPDLPALSFIGTETLNKGMVEIGKVPPFSVSHITNNVHYILKLEDGGSKQAPNGMLVLTFAELTEMFR